MTNPNDNAFPFQRNGTQNIVQFGLTKLEIIAKDAMVGLLAYYAGAGISPNPDLLAAQALRYAKALITELNKEQ